MPSFRKKKRSLFCRITSSAPYLFVMGWLIRGILELYYTTLRIHFDGIYSLPQKTLITLWHNRLLLAPLLRKKIPTCALSIVVSKSRDGLLLAALANTYRNVNVIYVGHLQRHKTPLDIIQELSLNRIVLITPDGPRGPVYVAKPGLHFCAEKADATIFCMDWQAEKFYTFKTWDKMRLPKPFSKVRICLNKGSY